VHEISVACWPSGLDTTDIGTRTATRDRCRRGRRRTVRRSRGTGRSAGRPEVLAALAVPAMQTLPPGSAFPWPPDRDEHENAGPAAQSPAHSSPTPRADVSRRVGMAPPPPTEGRVFLRPCPLGSVCREAAGVRPGVVDGLLPVDRWLTQLLGITVHVREWSGRRRRRLPRADRRPAADPDGRLPLGRLGRPACARHIAALPCSGRIDVLGAPSSPVGVRSASRTGDLRCCARPGPSSSGPTGTPHPAPRRAGDTPAAPTSRGPRRTVGGPPAGLAAGSRCRCGGSFFPGSPRGWVAASRLLGITV
jgi:hypothetical protein